MTTRTSAELTINEAAILAGVSMRRIVKDCEEGIVPKHKSVQWMRNIEATHVPRHAVVYAAAMHSVSSAKLEKKAKKLVWRHLLAKGLSFGTLELGPVLTFRLDPKATEAWKRTQTYLEARKVYLASDPEIFGGEPILKGTRITCQALLGRVEGGETLEDLIEDYPDIPKEAFDAALIYARTHPPRGKPSSGKPWREKS